MNKLYRLLRYDWPMHWVLLLTNWLPDNIFFIRLRGGLVSPFFKSCGRKLGIGRNVVFYNPSRIEIGDWVYIAYGCWFSSSNGVKIEDEVLFGPFTVITTANHTRKNKSFRFGTAIGDQVIFKKGCWVGAHCTVLPGSIIGEGSVIGANSVVMGIVTPNCLYAGNPCEIKKEFHD